MANDKIVIAGVSMSRTAAELAERAGCDVRQDVERVTHEGLTHEALLAECLDGSDASDAEAWADYASAIVGAAPMRLGLDNGVYDDARVSLMIDEDGLFLNTNGGPVYVNLQDDDVNGREIPISEAARLVWSSVAEVRAACERVCPESRIWDWSETLKDDGESGDVTCPHCGATPRLRTCHGCGTTALVTDCGHQSQPRPISAGRSDGSESHHDFCEGCAVRQGGA